MFYVEKTVILPRFKNVLTLNGNRTKKREREVTQFSNFVVGACMSTIKNILMDTR